MKKIMITLGAVVFTAVAQAASINWTVNAATKYAGIDVYIANSSSYTSIQALQADLLGTAGNSGSMTVASGGRSATSKGFVDGLEVNKEYEFYFVFVDENNNYWVSDKQIATTPALETDTMPNVNIASSVGSNILGSQSMGTLANVPEPTSGLLLLFGVAGLALRRRRA